MKAVWTASFIFGVSVKTFQVFSYKDKGLILCFCFAFFVFAFVRSNFHVYVAVALAFTFNYNYNRFNSNCNCNLSGTKYFLFYVIEKFYVWFIHL